MSHLYFPTEILECFCIDSFKNFGFSEDESKIITDVLLTSDKFGIESHGMQRISRYHKGIQKGLIKVDAVPEVIFETVNEGDFLRYIVENNQFNLKDEEHKYIRDIIRLDWNPSVKIDITMD